MALEMFTMSKMDSKYVKQKLIKTLVKFRIFLQGIAWWLKKK